MDLNSCEDSGSLRDIWLGGQQDFAREYNDSFVRTAASISRKLFFCILSDISTDDGKVTALKLKNVRAKQRRGACLYSFCSGAYASYEHDVILHYSELFCQRKFLPRYLFVAAPARKLTVDVLRLLTARRKQKELSVYALSQKCGVSQQMISYVESGERNPTLETVIKIARGLEVPLSKILKEAEKLQ